MSDGLTLPFAGIVTNGTEDAFSIKNTAPGQTAVAGSSEGGMGVTGEGFLAGVFGGSADGIGVRGQSTNNRGVFGQSETDVGVRGECFNGIGVSGDGKTGVRGDGSAGVNGRGVHGKHGLGSGEPPKVGTGVFGESDNGFGVYGSSGKNAGVHGLSKVADGVLGISQSDAHAGVSGVNDSGGYGVFGISRNGVADESTGVFGESDGCDGVRGVSHAKNHAGLSGINDSGGIGVFGLGATAGSFHGDVEVDGDIRVLNNHDIRLGNADCAEDFDISGAEQLEPGTVMVINQGSALQQCQQAYDKRVAGVISGAGDYKPAITLDNRPTKDRNGRLPIALLGKVYCKVDAQYAPVEVGDLLTTSTTPGYAMRANDPLKSFGAVIGKALRPLEAGQGLIPILIALQ